MALGVSGAASAGSFRRSETNSSFFLLQKSPMCRAIINRNPQINHTGTDSFTGVLCVICGLRTGLAGLLKLNLSGFDLAFLARF